MDDNIWMLAVLVIAFLIIGPILGIIAFFRSKRLESQRPPDYSNQVQLLTQRVAVLERAIALQTQPGAAPIAPTAPAVSAQPPTPAVAALPSRAPQAPAPPAPPRQLSPPSITAAPPLKPPTPPAQRPEFESLVGGRWFHYAGILAILFGVAFFIKYAFDNHWVGPTGRIAIGVILGAALVAWSHMLLARGYRYFSEGIAGLGAAVLYISIWAGWHFYSLFPQNIAFASMIVITAAMTVIAIGRNSERIAILAAIGGLITPALLSTGENHELALFTYIGILDAGLLAVAWFRKWRWVIPLQLAGTLFYFWGWYSDFYDASHALALTSAFATIFFLIFTAIPLLRARKTGELHAEELILVPVNGLAYLWALYILLWPENRWWLTLASLAIAALYLLTLRMLPPVNTEGGRNARVLFSGFALTCATLAIPIRLDGRWITVALAIEGAILIWSGFRAQMWGLRAAGLLLFAIVGARLALIPIPAQQAFWNARFATFAMAVACFAFAALQWRNAAFDVGDSEKSVFSILAVATNVYALAALSMETWTYVGHMSQLGIDRWLAQQLALSLVWTAYAIALLVYGVIRQIVLVRWQALLLLAVVVAKVFLFDLSSLDKIYRIVSFVFLGLTLLIISFYYQKRQVRAAQDRRS